MIRLYNTLTGQLEEFKPISGKEVRMYTCGPTVYDFAHIGNFRAFIFEDLLRRVLEAEGYQVRHVMNITDVDDKTIAGAIREKRSLDDYTEFYIRSFLEDLAVLQILTPTLQPRATREIDGDGGMIALIQKLIDQGAAYASEGSVYYRVASFPAYGRLSKKNLDKNIQGARVDVDEYDKEEGSDFVLWKKTKEGEPSWDSPWGKGRPGWHIECSAMSMKYLGETFDIHAGGEDLIFPHHENEIAQSEAATGKPFVRHWVHCKFLLVNGEKMSKSKGNFFTLRDLLKKKYDPVAVRYALLAVHYRQPLNFTMEGLKEAAEVIKKIDECYFQCLSLHQIPEFMEAYSVNRSEAKLSLPEILNRQMEAIRGGLGQDLNVSAALSALQEAVHEINSLIAEHCLRPEGIKAALDFFKKIDSIFGLSVTEDCPIPPEVINLLKERYEVRSDAVEFRKNRQWQEASDRMRAQIEGLGWLVKDGRPGEPSTVKRVRRVWDKK